ncbi:M20 metallopeptidase family protein [Actinoplanes auranticolor]|uniref:N-acyl-L-amino acid amidohydrolase n=1 Tax=Actinoplanes auranticolor TaxID=47988 RepID=A0A919S461_9ACTN|nr:amidohydrolase [Actinoplanes auranticolor]GIM64010.1 N-acyl-L-amino acid amidohydrolase [Actinoplanes auranticolor]
MSDSGDRVISRRVMLGSAAGVIGAGLVPAGSAQAGGGSRRGPVDQDAVDAVAARLDDDLIELRRDLHRHPEIAGQEERTAEVVARRLRAAGLHVTTGVGGHGVVALLTGARRGRTVAYRADMDAVAPDEQVGGGPQPAHLCGHDLHTTVGVGVAEVLARLRHRLAGTVAFFFQPAEERLTGAAAMLDAGVLGRVRPAEIHALHCGPFPVGQFVVTPGYGLPGQDRGVITLTGADAMARAQRLAAQVAALSTVTRPSTGADLEQLVADFQTPDGPLAEFVAMQAGVPAGDRAEVRVSYRCWPEERYAGVREDIRRLARSAGPAVVDFPKDPFPAMVCPPKDALALKRYLQQTAGRGRVATAYAALPFSGEDFALFLNRIPGTYTFLGVRSPGAAIETSYPHFGAFTPDERAIGHGVRAMAGWLAKRAAMPRE